MAGIERSNRARKGVLPKEYSRAIGFAVWNRPPSAGISIIDERGGA